MTSLQLTELIKNAAFELGFDFFGVSSVQTLVREAEALRNRSAEGFTADMNYLTRNIDSRANISIAYPEVKSIISLAVNYYPQHKQNPDTTYRISKYAYGKDYHTVIAKMLEPLSTIIKNNTNARLIKTFIDDSGLFEKALAAKAGLGSVGKNTLLITSKGSFCFLCEIITDIDLISTESPEKDVCGQCQKCIDACPTKALTKAFTLDARKCISYHTIENKNPSGEAIIRHSTGYIFGCDICQDVCPHNSRITPTSINDFKGDTAFLSLSDEQWKDMRPDTFQKLFIESGIKRTGHQRIQRNISGVKKRADQ